MKKLKLNSTLNHKCDSYDPYEVSVEKVITLYRGRKTACKRRGFSGISPSAR